MKIDLHYGDEKLDLRFLTNLMKHGYTLDSLLEMDTKQLADSFIDASILMDGAENYFNNMILIYQVIAKKDDDFYHQLTEKIRGLDIEIPKQTSLFLYAL